MSTVRYPTTKSAGTRRVPHKLRHCIAVWQYAYSFMRLVILSLHIGLRITHTRTFHEK
jgi:hypothetical protein